MSPVMSSRGAHPLPFLCFVIFVIFVARVSVSPFRGLLQSRTVGPGDIVIIPAVVYHGFTDVTDHVLPAGYVHPLSKK